VTGEHVREGMENLDLTQARLDQLGFGKMMQPIKVSCNDHEGKGPVIFQQWDGKQWKLVSDWMEPMRDVVRPKLEAAAVDEVQSKNLGYTKRDCSKEM
jgi:branched-chain amino acid transport system substrate-binding protein